MKATVQEEAASLWLGWFSAWWRQDGTEPWRVVAVEQTLEDVRREMYAPADDGEFLIREPGMVDPNSEPRRKAKPARKVAEKSKQLPALLSEDEAKQAAAEIGLTLQIFYANGDAIKKAVPHWQFRDADGKVVLHWWPSKGSFWDGKRKGKCARAWQAISLAKRLLAGESITTEAR